VIFNKSIKIKNVLFFIILEKQRNKIIFYGAFVGSKSIFL